MSVWIWVGLFWVGWFIAPVVLSALGALVRWLDSTHRE